MTTPKFSVGDIVYCRDLRYEGDLARAFVSAVYTLPGPVVYHFYSVENQGKNWFSPESFIMSCEEAFAERLQGKVRSRNLHLHY